MAYNLLLPVHVVTAGDMSGNITSSAVEIKYQDNIGIQLIWTGAPSGSFDVQVSIDKVIWNSLPYSPSVSATAAPGNAFINLNQLSAFYIRIVFNHTGGTGVLNAQVVGKGI